jgi:hypothetical protein
LDASTTSPALHNRLCDRTSHYQWFWRFARSGALIAVLILAGTRLHHGEVRAAFTRLTIFDIVVVVFVLGPLGVLLRALRWRYLLSEGDHLSLRECVGAYLVGVLANSLVLGKFGAGLRRRKLISLFLSWRASKRATRALHDFCSREASERTEWVRYGR